MTPLLSICIPSYNRKDSLIRLLETIDDKTLYKINVFINEDKSPNQLLIREAINSFRERSNLEIHYRENVQNIGYDGNLQDLITRANGDFIMFMGDDDFFITENFDEYLKFLFNNRDLAYILRTYKTIHEDGSEELFKYYTRTTFFPPGEKTYIELFRKSVFISGFCFKRKLALPFITNEFNGTLLYQLYLVAELSLNNKCAYFDLPITMMKNSMREKPLFGSSDSEKGLYSPGSITIENSLNFMKGFFKISNYIDKKYSIKSTTKLQNDISKYSYPILSIQRERGLKDFIYYVKMLKKEIGIHSTGYFYIYYYGLILFGMNNCNRLILLIKKFLGKTPKL
jgi:abequosyltransferase